MAIKQVLDNPVPVQFPDDHRSYLVGTVPSRISGEPHVVAVAQQTVDGTRDAAWLCGHMPHVFKNLQTFVMCGIAGGVPSTDAGRNVALGDIVVAEEVVDYRHERLVDGSTDVRATVQPPGAVWMNADHEVEAAEIEAAGNGGPHPWLPSLRGAPRPGAGQPRAHRGRVGSADLLVRDAVFRDGLAHKHRLLAFEMEGAGVAIGSHLGGRSFFMVRGIADHGDNATKNDDWHPYASLAAACYLRAVLARCRPFVSARKAAPGQRTSTGALNAVVEALAELRVMRDETQRRAVLDQLPVRVRVQIPENVVGRLHIIETVKALQSYPDGLDMLLDALHLTIGDGSAGLARAEQVLRANWVNE